MLNTTTFKALQNKAFWLKFMCLPISQMSLCVFVWVCVWTCVFVGVSKGVCVCKSKKEKKKKVNLTPGELCERVRYILSALQLAEIVCVRLRQTRSDAFSLKQSNSQRQKEMRKKRVNTQ